MLKPCDSIIQMKAIYFNHYLYMSLQINYFLHLPLELNLNLYLEYYLQHYLSSLRDLTAYSKSEMHLFNLLLSNYCLKPITINLKDFQYENQFDLILDEVIQQKLDGHLFLIYNCFFLEQELYQKVKNYIISQLYLPIYLLISVFAYQLCPNIINNQILMICC